MALVVGGAAGGGPPNASGYGSTMGGRDELSPA
jgi:hypothetical protein